MGPGSTRGAGARRRAGRPRNLASPAPAHRPLDPLAPDRPGHGQSPPARQDFDPEAALVADQLLDQPSHLVGHSYGAIVSMYAAALRPDNVLSLTIAEPPTTAVARGIPAVDEYATAIRSLIDSDLTPAEGLRRFFTIAGVPVEVPDEPHPTLLKGMRQLLGARSPDEADPPLSALRDAPFPILVVSGGHSEAQEIICDTIARETTASRAVCRGRDHLVPEAPDFNAVLERFLSAPSFFHPNEPVSWTDSKP
ncbi:alpha/beta hydrolase [Lentzea sp. BCCO 10_0856]|uniref:Alpha/beta hydrolase n=1 Tax=Lentzea miocenica TaxID=3095431 RepID=A0ABU4ST07_9PSEU|nr:alpha/beta hydrolase [Lentzea sp. BCCO 10_0856]MDX8029042.1 alpha/beta hydrolase [Lentzea sp. BCCO 10_0856]